MTYLSINFPNNYSEGQKVFLKDILSEKEGIKFSIILMRQILNTQVEEIKEERITGTDERTRQNPETPKLL